MMFHFHDVKHPVSTAAYMKHEYHRIKQPGARLTKRRTHTKKLIDGIWSIRVAVTGLPPRRT
jgi:hypothetical protein